MDIFLPTLSGWLLSDMWCPGFNQCPEGCTDAESSGEDHIPLEVLQCAENSFLPFGFHLMLTERPSFSKARPGRSLRRRLCCVSNVALSALPKRLLESQLLEFDNQSTAGVALIEVSPSGRMLI